MGGGKKGGEDDNGRCVYKYRLHCANSNSDPLLLPHPSSPTFLPTPFLPPPPTTPSSPTPLAPLLLPWSRPPTPSLRPPHPPLTRSSSHPSSPAPPLTPYPPILLPAHPPSTPTDYRCCVLACENSTIKVTARPSCHINSRMAILKVHLSILLRTCIMIITNE